MPASIACAHAGVTTGEWGQTLREVFGEYRAPTGVAGARARPPPTCSPRCASKVEAAHARLGRRLKMLVGKPGLDGHSNGAEQIAVAARDSGIEVVYEGIRLTPARIANAALEEGVHIVGLSILSGSHMPLVKEVLRRMRELGIGEIPVVVGGIIPPEDAKELLAAGVARVYTPKDYEIQDIMSDLVDIAGGVRAGGVRHAALARLDGEGQIPRMTRPHDVDEIKGTLKAMLPELQSRWPLSYLGVFGSWARREQGGDSDLDLLVDFDRPDRFRDRGAQGRAGAPAGPARRSGHARLAPPPDRPPYPRRGRAGVSRDVLDYLEDILENAQAACEFADGLTARCVRGRSQDTLCRDARAGDHRRSRQAGPGNCPHAPPGHRLARNGGPARCHHPPI